MTEQTTTAPSDKLIHIHQGECRISEDPRVVLTTRETAAVLRRAAQHGR
jgi:hypothetical protein